MRVLFIRRTLFLIATVPNIVNGFHVSSYVFVGRMPDQYWCDVPALRNASWSTDNIIAITTTTSIRYIHIHDERH